ncbi:CAP domain-containing protein [Streptomyces sp. NPDC093224]|uniref:CAP domain-containing protein n=1 Tax=Streptomyces sp. NPDC093224 TaxID=3155198 RepID=UPI00343DD6E8
MGRHRLPAPPRRGGKHGTALRTGLLGVSVAVALGTAAVTTGMVPVGASFPYVGVDGADTATPAAKADPSAEPGTAAQQQNGLVNLSGRSATAPGSTSPSRPASPKTPASPSAPPSPAASPSPSAPSAPAAPSAPPSTSAAPVPSAPPSTRPAVPAPAPSAEAPQKEPAPEPSKPATPASPEAPSSPAPRPTATPEPSASATRPSLTGHSAEEDAVVTLVNQARAQAGCGPVRANPPLASLAGAFSKDMATRGFFGHDDPDGNTPWDRAAKAGIGGLGGENIARGQGDADAVMKAWMNSPGHKANILNCEFRTLGVGVYAADGGPWWTQDFGF